LGNRRSTVFSVPRREVVETEDYETARELNNGSLGSQSWWLFPRIREVDVFLQRNPSALERTYESHPELCYYALSEEQLDPKDTESGTDTRLSIIDDMTDDIPEFYDEVETVVRDREDGAEWPNRISRGRRDDVLDAAILAVTGSQLELQQRSQMDSYPSLSGETISGDDTKLGITPEIVYPK
jgi:predicted RNase H-like nuclease